jgi:peroxiredoxin
VIPGKYDMSIWLEERFTGRGPPEEIGGYSGTIEVPEIPGGRTDEPLDLGNLVLYLAAQPLQAGDVAPVFEAKDVGGANIRLADHRGRFVLLCFWQPVHDPELDRLRELYQTYAGAGKLQILGLVGGDTLEEVRKYLRDKKIKWPQIYVGAGWDHEIAKAYRMPGIPYLLLVDPEGKIVATRLRGEKLRQAVKAALDQAP